VEGKIRARFEKIQEKLPVMFGQVASKIIALQNFPICFLQSGTKIRAN